AVYACPLSASTSDCQRLDIELKSEPDKAIIDDMWLGVTVASQRQPAGRVLACAHRYTKVLWSGSEDQRRMVGKCYVRGNDLRLNISDEWQTYHNEMCNSNTDTDETGMCQMGTSAGFTANIIYFGAPGAYNWQGPCAGEGQGRAAPFPGDVWCPDPRGASPRACTGVCVCLRLGAHACACARPSACLSTRVRSRAAGVRGERVPRWGRGAALPLADLVVGAPYYFQRKQEGGGGVYVYMNEVGGFRTHPRGGGGGPSYSAFGFAVASIGGGGGDGFQDIAVGGGGEGPGKVYIYHSSAEGRGGGARQVISGSEGGGGSMQTFGYSLSGGLDAEGGGGPDLLVGSLAERVVLLRGGGGQLWVPPTPLSSPPPLGGGGCLCQHPGAARRARSRVGGGGSWHQARLCRCGGEGGGGGGAPSLPRARPDNIRDKLHPIVLSLNYSLVEKPRTFQLGPHSLDAFPVLNQDQSHENETKVEFQKECGSDNKCYSNLQLQSSFVTDQNQPLPRLNGTQVLQYSRDVRKLYLSINITNVPTTPFNGEDAHEALLNLTVPASLLPSSVRPSGACTFGETVLCELGNPFKRNQRAELIITFEAIGIMLDTRELLVWLDLSTQSTQEDLQPTLAKLLVDYSIQSSLAITSSHTQSYFSGTVVGESAMRGEQDVGSPLAFDFQVTTKGESLGNLGTILLGFEWPYEIPNGKWLLYPTEILVNSNSTCHPPGGVINPLNLTVSHPLLGDEAPSRQRRELDPPEPAEPPVTLPTAKKHKSQVVLSCSKGTARCIWFECPLLDTQHPTTFSIRARVWNSTFIEEYHDFDRVKVDGTATLFLRTHVPTINMRNHTVRFSVDVDSELTEEQPAEIALWLVLVAVAAGLLLLGLIILLLWK
ncbi:ITA3 protein, partial [Podilymbus podiceps]|nr:ITA3 protein [Podilymbus podiceps]